MDVSLDDDVIVYFYLLRFRRGPSGERRENGSIREGYLYVCIDRHAGDILNIHS